MSRYGTKVGELVRVCHNGFKLASPQPKAVLGNLIWEVGEVHEDGTISVKYTNYLWRIRSWVRCRSMA